MKLNIGLLIWLTGITLLILIPFTGEVFGDSYNLGHAVLSIYAFIAALVISFFGFLLSLLLYVTFTSKEKHIFFMSIIVVIASIVGVMVYNSKQPKYEPTEIEIRCSNKYGRTNTAEGVQKYYDCLEDKD